MKTKITRRRFIQSAALATSGLTLESNLFAAKTKTASEAFSFVLLGDLHLDKLEHHDLDHLRKSDAKQLPQIERYSRITSEVTPKLFSTLQKTITDLNKNSATHAAFTIQVGDFVEGVCTSPELSKQHFDYALNFVRESKLATPFLFTKGNHEINSPGSINLYQSDLRGDQAGGESAKSLFHRFARQRAFHFLRRLRQTRLSRLDGKRFGKTHRATRFCGDSYAGGSVRRTRRMAYFCERARSRATESAAQFIRQTQSDRIERTSAQIQFDGARDERRKFFPTRPPQRDFVGGHEVGDDIAWRRELHG